MELRDYQKECVDRVLAAYEKDAHGFEYLVLPTGSGKTVIFSHVIHELRKRYNVNALIIAHRDELLDQAADKYRQINPSAVIGKIGSGIHEYGGEVTVASIATISRPEHIKRLQAIGYGVIIVDEFHHSASAGYQNVLKALNAFVFGVTATPDRLDKKDITRGKQPLYQSDIIQMVERGYLCQFKAIAIRTEVSLDELHTQMGDFNEHELELAINTPARSLRIVAAYQEHAAGKRAVVFCVTVSHAQALADAFNAAGVPAAVIKGATPIDERKHIYQAFHAGEILVLCTVMVLTEGWDEPRCEVAIMARPTQSRGLYVQQFGRILRPLPGKVALLLDITDNCTKHRLMPQNLRRAIGKQMRDGETLAETLAREEAAEKEAQTRKLKEQRVRDIYINLMEKIEWEERDNGLYVLECCREKHRIAIIPSKTGTDLFFVSARLAPDFEYQRWTNDLSLEACQQEAEKKVHMLLAGEKALVDKRAPWRARLLEPDSAQAKKMRFHHLEITPGMTKGQASDAIDAHLANVERERVAKAERKAAREAVMKEEVSA